MESNNLRVYYIILAHFLGLSNNTKIIAVTHFMPILRFTAWQKYSGFLFIVFLEAIKLGDCYQMI